MLRCPVCRAGLEQGPQCRRCRADLGLLFALEDQRRHALREAYQALAARQWDHLRRLAERVHGLRNDAESLRLVALGRLLTQNFAGAFQTYTCVDRQPPSGP